MSLKFSNFARHSSTVVELFQVLTRDDVAFVI